jgi:hypothetical protein
MLANPWYQTRIMSDHILDQVLLFDIAVRGSLAGLCGHRRGLDTASRVRTDYQDSWTHERRKTGERLRRMAGNSAQACLALSAGEAYLRAAIYSRAAALHCSFNPIDPSIKELAALETASFSKAILLLGIPNHLTCFNRESILELYLR